MRPPRLLPVFLSTFKLRGLEIHSLLREAAVESVTAAFHFVKSLLSACCALLIVGASADPLHASGRNLYEFDSGLRLGGAHLFTPWWNALQRNTLQRVQFDVCVAQISSCSRSQRPLRHLIVNGRQLSVKDRLELVNRYLNRWDYDEDSGFNNQDPLANQLTDKPSPRSHWSTLFEFLRRGGDCEDYASSKYLLLRMLGVEAARMRVVVAKETGQPGHHAVLAYRWENGEVWLLESDNVIKKRSHRGYRYVFALNENGVWDYRAP